MLEGCGSLGSFEFSGRAKPDWEASHVHDTGKPGTCRGESRAACSFLYSIRFGIFLFSVATLTELAMAVIWGLDLKEIQW